MKLNLFIRATIFTAMLPTALFAQEHDLHQHHHHGEQASQLQLNAGKKWAIDDSLHIGMTGIKDLIATDVDAIHVNDFSASQYQHLAEKIDGKLKYLFKNCKLPQDADAQLHVLLAKVMQASHQMKQSQGQKSGVIAIINAMKAYPEYFNDPKWQPLVH